MDPSWSRCPHCLKEGREGRLITSGGGPRPGTDPANRLNAAPPPAAPVIPPSVQEAPPVAQAPGAIPPQPQMREMPPAPPEAPRPPADGGAYRYPPAEPPRLPSEQPPGPPPRGDRPQSSVGQTFVIRRRPRVLAYLIEKEGEQVGRVFQLEDDVTDIGRDPRNHVVVNDVMVSGFHARIERGPDGNFVVMDRGSTNGSRLNGDPLTAPRPFNEGDEVGLGSTALVLKVVG
jgi:hypothetical protein